MNNHFIHVNAKTCRALCVGIVNEPATSPLSSTYRSFSSSLNLELQVGSRMSAPTLWRTSARLSQRLLAAKERHRCLSCSLRLAQEQAKENAQTTHFGFENVPESEKESRGIFLNFINS